MSMISPNFNRLPLFTAPTATPVKFQATHTTAAVVAFGQIKQNESFELAKKTYGNPENQGSHRAIYDPAALDYRNIRVLDGNNTAEGICGYLANSPFGETRFVIGKLSDVKRAAKKREKESNITVAFDIDSQKADGQTVIRIRKKLFDPDKSPVFQSVVSKFPKARPEQCYKDNLMRTRVRDAATDLVRYPEQTTAYVLARSNNGKYPAMASRLRASLGKPFEIDTWQIPGTTQTIVRIKKA